MMFSYDIDEFKQFVCEQLREDAETKVFTISQEFVGNRLKVYRMIRVPPSWRPDTKNLGIF